MEQDLRQTDSTEDGLRERPVAPSCPGSTPSGSDSAPSSFEERLAAAAERAKALRRNREAHIHPVQPIRAISEDDDGYDPYSDLHDQHAAEPLFEHDPWS